jgi:hypothetical protein
LAITCHRPSSRTRVNKSVKCLGKMAHCTRARAVTGPTNSMAMMRSTLGSPRLAGEGRWATIGKYSSMREHTSVPPVAQAYKALG